MVDHYAKSAPDQPLRPGPRNLITDVPGLKVGQAEDWHVRTGVTVTLCDTLFSASADVRGGGPGNREIDVLSSENLIGGAHAFVLTGGSVFGLAAADGVVQALSETGRGLAFANGPHPIPIVPAAVLHDLTSGGDKDWGQSPPYHGLGRTAVEAAGVDFDLGAFGAGVGARAGTAPGGIGSASIDLGGGLIVGALIAANPAGSVYMPDGETFWSWPYELDEEFGGNRPGADCPLAVNPLPVQSRLSAGSTPAAGTNTTIGLVATSANLTTAECKRVAMMAQDGLARAARPAHTPFDGDTIFSVATAHHELQADQVRPMELARIGSAAADCVARAIARAVFHATGANR